MDKKQLELKRNKKKAKILSCLLKCESMKDIIKTFKSTQGLFRLIRYYNLKCEYKKQIYRIKKIINTEIPKTPGVYCLFFVEESKIKYYGSTKNLNKRIRQHCSLLKINKHDCLELQKLYNIYGFNSLRFEIIKTFDESRYLKKDLLLKEKELINNDNYCCNKNTSIQTKDERIIQIKKYSSELYEKSKVIPFKKSKFKGITYWRVTKQWKAQPFFKINGKWKQIYLGYFNTEEEANKAIIKYKKEITI